MPPGFCPTVAGAARRGPPRPRPVRGAVHPERGGGAGALRDACRPDRERGGRPRPPLAARRLPHPLRGARAARGGSSREITPLTCADAGRAAPGGRGTGEEERIPLRGRRSSRRWSRRWKACGARCRSSPSQWGGSGRSGTGRSGSSPAPRTTRSAAWPGLSASTPRPTMDRIGTESQGIVREIFRNLVTAHGTRAVIDREELLSALPDKAAARAGARRSSSMPGC